MKFIRVNFLSYPPTYPQFVYTGVYKFKSKAKSQKAKVWNPSIVLGMDLLDILAKSLRQSPP